MARAVFIDRFRNYLSELIKKLHDESGAAAIFSNPVDNGHSKEKIFLEILKLHLPSSYNIFMGGFIFNLAGEEFKQIDIIINDSQSLKFNLLNKNEDGKSYGCIDGTIAAISIKSYLNKESLFEALENIASIPVGTQLNKDNSNRHVNFDGMNNGPLKVIFALNGKLINTILEHLEEFYRLHPEIPLNRRPNYIHVLGKYSVIKLRRPTEVDDGNIYPAGTFCPRTFDVDLFFISSLFTSIEIISRLHRHIFYNYTTIFELAVPPAKIRKNEESFS